MTTKLPTSGQTSTCLSVLRVGSLGPWGSGQNAGESLSHLSLVPVTLILRVEEPKCEGGKLRDTHTHTQYSVTSPHTHVFR